MIAILPRQVDISGTTVTAEALSKENFIGLEVDSRLGQLVRSAFDRDAAVYDPRVEVRYCSTAAVLVAAGIGSAVIDPYTAAFHSSLSVTSKPFLPPIEVGAVMMTRKGVPRSRLLHAFISEMKRALAEFDAGIFPSLPVT